jgi:hypothetical protein
MRLVELSENPIITKIVAISDQLKTDLEDGTILPNMSMEDFIKYLQEYDVPIDPNDLYKMIKKPPLNKLISNIKDGQIVFKGFNSNTEPKPEQDNKKIVKQMAKSAQKL